MDIWNREDFTHFGTDGLRPDDSFENDDEHGTLFDQELSLNINLALINGWMSLIRQ